jgi:hypothetical protein
MASMEFDGDAWELRHDDINMYEEVYATHMSCTYKKVEADAYARLWSWEVGDYNDAEDGLPWCHYCHTPVPDEVQAVVMLLQKGES